MNAMGRYHGYNFVTLLPGKEPPGTGIAEEESVRPGEILGFGPVFGQSRPITSNFITLYMAARERYVRSLIQSTAHACIINVQNTSSFLRREERFKRHDWLFRSFRRRDDRVKGFADAFLGDNTSSFFTPLRTSVRMIFRTNYCE